MKVVVRLFAAAALMAGSSPLVAQPKNHIGEPMAQIMIVNGCVMSEAEVSAAMKANGWTQSDVQAQVTALYNGRYMGSAPGGKWRLQNWDPCT